MTDVLIEKDFYHSKSMKVRVKANLEDLLSEFQAKQDFVYESEY